MRELAIVADCTPAAAALATVRARRRLTVGRTRRRLTMQVDVLYFARILA